jgi:hypothetical protein
MRTASISEAWGGACRTMTVPAQIGRQAMDGRINTGEGIAIAGVWIAVAVVAIVSLPFAVMVFPLVIPVAAVWGGVVVTRQILGRRKVERHEGTETVP